MSKSQITDLSLIHLTAEDLSDFTPYLASSHEIDSPTAPAKPFCLFGWRDRWWLEKRPGQQVSISYWLFADEEEAYTAANEGRFRLSARTVRIHGLRDSVYQPPEDADRLVGGYIWQADHNFLFVKHNVVVLVAEYGKQVPLQTTQAIARQILGKIVDNVQG